MVLQKVFSNWTSSEGLQYVIVQCPLKEGDIHKGVMTPYAPEAINGTLYKNGPQLVSAVRVSLEHTRTGTTVSAGANGVGRGLEPLRQLHPRVQVGRGVVSHARSGQVCATVGRPRTAQ